MPTSLTVSTQALHGRLVRQGEYLAACSAAATSLGRGPSAAGGHTSHLAPLAERRANGPSAPPTQPPQVGGLGAPAPPTMLPSLAALSASLGSGAGRVPPRLAAVRAAELAAVPKYMAGRLTAEKLNAALEEVQGVVDDKYRLLQSSHGRVSERLLKKQRAWRDQESRETRGAFFFTENDVRDGPQLHLRLDGTSGKGTLATLVHLGRLRCLAPTAPGGVRRYVIVSGDEGAPAP